MDSAEKVAKACEGFESQPAIVMTDKEGRGIEITALCSIAISLKRIADRYDKMKADY